MAVTASTRLGITRWSADSDPFNRTQTDGDHALLDSLTAIDVQDLLANRPAPGVRGKFFSESSASAGLPGTTWRDDGSSWRSVGSRIVAASSTDIAQIVRGAASQSANMAQYQTSAGAVLTAIDNDGVLLKSSVYTIGQNADPTTQLQARAANQRALIVKGFASQSVDIFDVQTSTGTNIFQVSPTNASFNSGVYFSATQGQIGVVGAGTAGNPNFYVSTGVAGGIGIKVVGVTSQTGDLQQWYDGGGNRASFVAADGSHTIKPFSATSIPLLLQGYTAQSGNLTEWRDSTAALLARVDSAGSLITTANALVSGYATAGRSTQDGVAAVSVQPLTTGGTGLTVRGLASQSGSLAYFLNSTGAVLVEITSGGTLNASQVNGTGLQVTSTTLSFPSLNGAPGGPVWKYLYWDSNTQVGRTMYGATISSSVVAKRDITPMGSAPIERLLALEPKRFRYHDEVHHGSRAGKPAPYYYGLIAEDLLDAGLRDLVLLDADDKPVTIYYDRIGAMLLPTIRDLRDRVAALEAA